MSMRDTIKRVLDQSFGPFGDGTVDRMANYVVAALPDYDAQQARIDTLYYSLGQLMQVQEGVPMTGIEATRRLKQAHAALKGSDT